MLTRYPEARSRDLNQLEASFFANAMGNRVDLPNGQPENLFLANAARFKDGALVFAPYGFPIGLGFDAVDFIRLHYQSDRASEVFLDGKPMENAASRSGYLVVNDRPWYGRYANGLDQLTLRVPATTLQRKLNALIGSDARRVELRQPSAADPRLAEELRASVFRFAGELDNADAPFVESLVTCWIDSLSLALLTCLGDEALASDRTPAAPSTVQLGRVEQYLVAHYAEPLTVETLAEVSGVSAQSVMWYFRSKHDCTPQQYVERVRLQMARLKLRLYPSNDTVEMVALQCGFGSTAAFVQAYQKTFGLPPLPKIARREPTRLDEE